MQGTEWLKTTYFGNTSALRRSPHRKQYVLLQ